MWKLHNSFDSKSRKNAIHKRYVEPAVIEQKINSVNKFSPNNDNNNKNSTKTKYQLPELLLYFQ